MRYEDASHTSAFQGQGPIANDDTDQMAAGAKSTATGNLISGEGTQTGSVGADIATGGHITEIAGKGGEDSNFAGGKLSVMGEYGKLSVDAEGNYSYQANKGVENVRDRFTYTLADSNGASDTAALIIEIGKTPFAVKADAQQVIVGPDGVVTLPAGVELSDVHVVGRNLVVDLPDGSQMIIIDGAVFVPQLVLGGVEVPSTNIAALLIGQEVAPAAGETPPSSGGNFGTPPPPLDPGVPLGDLIPPTEYDYHPPEPQPTNDILDRKPDAGAANAILDDDAQEGGNPGGVGDDPGSNFDSGFLPGSGGDGTLEWDLLASGTLPAGFSFSLQGNGDLWIMQGAAHVMTVTVNPDTGAFTVTQLQAIDHPAGGDENNLNFVINYSVTDDDGDVAVGSLTVNVDDDTPEVHVIAGADQQVILTTDDAQTIGAASDTDATSANFSGVFSGTTVSFGADGPGPGSSSTYTLAVTGQNSGLTSHGATINLFVVGGVVIGTTAGSAGAIDAGNTIFTVSTTNTGVVTLTQLQQIDHPIGQDPTPSGTPFADQFISMVDGLVTLTRAETVVDGDGDQVTGSATVNIGANLHFTDDGPTMGLADRGEPTLNVDETNLGNNDNASFAANFSANFGADGPAAAGSITYALGVNAGATGLFDTATGEQVVLSVVNGQVIGTAGVGGPTVFVVSVDANGVVTLDQQRAVVHDVSSDPDTSEAATTIPDNLITLTATAHDFDGDTASQSLNIGSNLSFHDDGPTAASGTTGQNVSVDETAGVQGDSNDTTNAGVIALFAGVSNAGVDPDMAAQYGSNAIAIVNSTGSVYGADGAGTTVFSLDVSSAGVDSGLDTTEGFDILLFKEGNLIVGRVDGGAHDGEAAFAIAIDPATGVVSMVEYLSIDHPTNPNPDESVSIDNGAIVATVTVTDKDGDFDSSSVGIGSHIQFQDDGPTVAPTLNAQATVTVDETAPSNTPGIDTGLILKGDDPDLSGGLAIGQGNSGSAIVDPHAVFGADGPAAAGSISYALSILNTSSGLTLTDGSPVNLQLVNGNIVGVVASGTFAGQAAFAISINSTTGVVTLEQYLSLDHPVNPNPNDPLSFGSDIIGVTVTATDGDGDPVTSPAVDVGGQLTFLDDGPSANNDTDTTDPITDQASGNVITGVGTNEGAANADQPHADGFGSITNLVGFNGSTDGNPAGGFDVNGEFGTLHMDASGNYTYTRTGGAGGATDTFTYTYVDGDGDPATATLVITLADNTPTLPDPDTIHLDDDVIPGAGGNAGGTDDDAPDTVGQNVANGQLNGSGGDGALTYSFTGSNTLPSGFTVNVVDADTIQIKQGTTVVMTIDLNLNTGAFTVTQNNPILHPSLDGQAGDNTENNLDFSIGVQVQDVDNDADPATITINVDDDTPTINVTKGDDSAISLTTDDAQTIGGASDTASTSANFGGVFGLTQSIGADGGPAGTLGFALGVSAPGVDSGLNAGGLDIHLYLIGGVVVGSTALTAGAVNAGNTVFDVTVSGTGVVTLTQYSQIDHPIGSDPSATGAPFADHIVSMADGLVTLTASSTITDNDGDSASDSEVVNIGANLHFTDDGPDVAAVLTGTLLKLDETDGVGVPGEVDPVGGNLGTITVAAATLFTVTQPHVSADAPQTLGYALSLSSNGVDSGLDVSSNNASIFLYNIGGVVTGSTSATLGGVNAGNTAFTVSIDANTGAVTMTQFLAIEHSNTASNDEDSSAIAAGALNVVVTGTDFDGDTDTASVDLGSVIRFEDDGPTINVTKGDDSAISLTTDDAQTIGGASDTASTSANFGGVFGLTSNGGSDGAASAPTLGFALGVSAPGVDSGLNAGGLDIHLYLIGGVVVGSTALTAGAVNAGNTVFDVTVSGTGVVTLTQYSQIDHPAGGDPTPGGSPYADHIVSMADSLITLTASSTITDNDGDQASDSEVVNIGANLHFTDDGPVAAIVTTGQTVSLDESAGNQVDSNDVTGPLAAFAAVANVGDDPDVAGSGPIQFATNVSALVASTGSAYGADGAGTTLFSLSVAPGGVDSGLDTTAGVNIFLFLEGGVVVGRVGATAGVAAGGPAAFALAIDPSTGAVSMVEYLSINHPNPANPDDSVSIINTAVQATVTVTDFDGDSTSNSVNIGSLISFQDSGPIMTAAQNMNIQNSGDVAHTAAFAFNLGADGPNIATNDVITNVTGSATVGGVAVQNWTLTPGVENATTASYSFSFDYPIGGGSTAHETGTLVFDKVAGTYTIDLDNPIQGVTTILQTATGTLFQGYEPETSTVDGSQPAISVTQIQDLPGTPNDIYVQFTSVAEPSSGTGDNNLEFYTWTPGSGNPAPVNGGGDTTWNPGQLFNQTDSWVSTSNDSNGVAGDTIQGGEVLDFNLVQGANPTGILADPSTYAQASSMFLKFDGIGSGEDMIVILKVYDTVAQTYSTVALMVQNSDIQKGPGSGPGIFSGVTLDNNDGLIVIEPNDYQQGNTNLVIVGAQIAGSDEGLTGTAIDFNYGGVLGGASTGTQAFSTDTSDGPMKISSIGFVSVQTSPQNAQLDFNVTVTDGDGDSITQAISATVTPAVDSVSAATIPAANTTVSQTPLGAKSTTAVGEQLAANSNTVTMAAAVAAAGVVDSQAAAAAPHGGHHADLDRGEALVQAHTLRVAADGPDHGSDAGSSALASQAALQVAPDVAQASSKHGPDVQAPLSLDKGHGSAPADASEHGAAAVNKGPVVADAHVAAAPTVAMLSAEALQAAGLTGNGKASGSVEKIVSEALGHGNGHGAVDALLDAFHGGHGGAAAMANLASASANGVPAWDMASDGASAMAHEMLMKVGASNTHHDMVLPTHNG